MEINENAMNELHAKAYAIIEEQLNSSDKYVSVDTALRVLNPLSMFVISKRIMDSERWADELVDRSDIFKQAKDRKDQK